MPPTAPVAYERLRSVRRTIAVAVVVTWAILAVRLLGELQGWDRRWFGTDAGGGAALLGIGWWIPVVGIVFAWQLRRDGLAPPSFRRAMALAAAGIVPVVIAFTIVKTLMGVTPAAMAVGGAGCVLGACLAARSWPALMRPLLLYALCARAPILGITFLDVQLGWGTHFGKLAEGAAELAPMPRAAVLCLAQLVFWVPLTLLGGLLAGLLVLGWRRGPVRPTPPAG